MAQRGNDRRSKNRNSSAAVGIGTAAAVTGGALVGAAILYGAKKLYDFMNEAEEKKSCEKDQLKTFVEPPSPTKTNTPLSPERPDLLPAREPQIDSACSSNTQSPRPSICTPSREDLTAEYESSLMADADPSVGSLHLNLLSYYTTDVDIAESEIQHALEVTEEIKHLFWTCIKNMLPNHIIKDMIFGGSYAEGSQVIKPTDFEVFILLDLDTSYWEFVDAGPTLLAAHGFHIVKRTNLDYFSSGTSAYDKYLVGDYLSPSKIKSILLDTVNRINWSSSYKVYPEVVGCDTKLDVVYGQPESLPKKLTINFIPAVKIGDTLVIAKSHPHSTKYPSYDNLWKVSHLHEEKEKLQNPAHGCQSICLKLLKAIQYNHKAHWSVLSDDILKAVLFHTMEQEDDWLESALGERFIDVMKALEDYLRSGRLPNYFNPYTNLLEGNEESDLITAADFISNVICEGNFDWLFK